MKKRSSKKSHAHSTVSGAEFTHPSSLLSSFVLIHPRFLYIERITVIYSYTHIHTHRICMFKIFILFSPPPCHQWMVTSGPFFVANWIIQTTSEFILLVLTSADLPIIICFNFFFLSLSLSLWNCNCNREGNIFEKKRERMQFHPSFLPCHRVTVAEKKWQNLLTKSVRLSVYVNDLQQRWQEKQVTFMEHLSSAIAVIYTLWV